jgi:hypothetical protein
MATATVPEKQIFVFTEDQTVADLVLVAKALGRAGRTPLLHFVRSYDGDVATVAIDVADAPKADGSPDAHVRPRLELTRAGRAAVEEMGVAGAEDNGEVLMPDPAGLSPELDAKLRKMLNDARLSSLTLDTPVIYEGRCTTWREVAGKVPCEFNDEGVLVAKPFASDPRG